jgi:hypothetical protein
MQPGFGHPEFAIDGSGRDSQDRPDLVIGEAAEKEEFDDLTFAGVEGSQPLEGFVQCQYVRPGFRADQDCFIQRHALQPFPALLPFSCAGMIHKDVAHDARRHCIKMSPIPPVPTGIGQADIGFMHQGCGAQGMIGAFGEKTTRRQSAKVVVNQGNQLIECFLLSRSQFPQQPRDHLAVNRAGIRLRTGL